MLRVALAPGLMELPGHGNLVLRTPEIYIVPRLDGSAVIGASIEDTGFDLSLDARTIDGLRERASLLVPALGVAPELERWAGLRPRSPDGLPLLGRTAPRRFVASGHFRNGILLAPATARVMADHILGQTAPVEIAPFRPSRFGDTFRPVSVPR